MSEESQPSKGASRTPPSRPLCDSVLRLIWEQRRISRAEIARRSELARSTVSEIVGILLQTGLVAEVGPGPSSGGRRPIVLEFQDNEFSLLGIEMGGAHIAVALTDLRGHVLAWEERPHPVRDDPEGTRRLMIELCDRVTKAKTGAGPLVGIGVAVPCPYDPAHPERLSELVMPAWGGLSGFEELSKRFGVPLLVDNDANLGALAERWWGAGVGVEDFAYIKIGTGIGSGHVIGGEIYRGATGVAGEIGHLAIDPNGGPCVCGLRGCLTTFVGAQALVSRAHHLLDEYPNSVLAGTEPTIDSIEDAALEGDPLALRLAQEAAEHMGIALAGLLNLMNPALVILGGGLSRLGDLLISPLRETVVSRTLVSSVAASELRTSQLGPRSVAVGAATLVLKTALANSNWFLRSAAPTQAR